MEPNKTIVDMFTRYTSTTNSLQSLEKFITNEEMVRKVLRSLPRIWEPKVTAITESKDLAKLDLQELLGSLLTHEINMKNYEKEPLKPKGLALKANNADSDEEIDCDDIAFITAQFKQYLKRKGSKFTKKNDSSTLTCYKCNKKGHVRSDCPLNKSKDSTEKRAHKATLDDSSDSDLSDNESHDEKANLCLMADIDDQVSGHSPEDIHDAFEELYDTHIAHIKKHKHMKALNEKLVKENEELKNTLEKLNKSTCNLHDLLSVQKYATDKTGLGFKKTSMHATPSTPIKFVSSTNCHVEENNFIHLVKDKTPTIISSQPSMRTTQTHVKKYVKKNPSGRTS